MCRWEIVKCLKEDRPTARQCSAPASAYHCRIGRPGTAELQTQTIDVIDCGGATFIQPLLSVPVCESDHPFEPAKAQV